VEKIPMYTKEKQIEKIIYYKIYGTKPKQSSN